MKTKIIKIKNGEFTELFKVACKTGAETGDIIYDKSEKKFHPVYRMGNTNICFTRKFQKSIHKVLASTREADNLPFDKLRQPDVIKSVCELHGLDIGIDEEGNEYCGYCGKVI